MQHIWGEYLVIPFNINYQIHGLRVTFLVPDLLTDFYILH